MILVPVKDLSGAKQRLAAVLDQPRRTALAQAMLQDVLLAIVACPGRPAVALVTSDAFAVHMATHFGFEVIADRENRGESEAINAATRIAEARGADFTLVLPGDIPLLQAAELESLLAAVPGEGVLLSPSADWRGSNAVYRRPCSLIPLRFGNDSFVPHRAAAEATGKPCVVREFPGIALDVDTPADLAALLSHPPRSRAQRLLLQWGIGPQVAAHV